MKAVNKYSDAQKNHAVNLRKIAKFTYAEIEQETGIPESYIRKLVHEENAKGVTLLVTGNATVVTDAPKEVAQAETAVTSNVMIEKQVENVEITGKVKGTGVTMFRRFLRHFLRHFSLMHLVFYATTATACYAMWDTLPNVIGASLLTVFALFSLDSVLKAQDGTRPEIAAYGRNRVIASELVAAVFHYSILNKYLWQNLSKLPFEVKLMPPKGGYYQIDFRGQILNGVWQNGEVIFIISIIISGLLFAAAFAAVDSVLRENKA